MPLRRTSRRPPDFFLPLTSEQRFQYERGRTSRLPAPRGAPSAAETSRFCTPAGRCPAGAPLSRSPACERSRPGGRLRPHWPAHSGGGVSASQRRPPFGGSALAKSPMVFHSPPSLRPNIRRRGHRPRLGSERSLAGRRKDRGRKHEALAPPPADSRRRAGGGRQRLHGFVRMEGDSPVPAGAGPKAPLPPWRSLPSGRARRHGRPSSAKAAWRSGRTRAARPREKGFAILFPQMRERAGRLGAGSADSPASRKGLSAQAAGTRRLKKSQICVLPGGPA